MNHFKKYGIPFLLLLSVFISMALTGCSPKADSEGYYKVVDVDNTGLTYNAGRNTGQSDSTAQVSSVIRFLDEDGQQITIADFKHGDSICVTRFRVKSGPCFQVQKSHKLPVGTYVDYP